jgi:Ran GTPase-activating protein (RanGAP) involved in mRNA processing and transport
VLQRRHLFNDGQQPKGRQRNRQQLAEAALTALSRQTTSVILEACGEILDKCCNTNKTLRAFIEALLCLFNFIVRYTVAAEFVSRQLLHQPNGNNNNNNNSNSSYHLAASLQQGQGSDNIAANLDNDKPLADIKLLYLDTNCDRLRTAVDTMAIKKRKLMHDAFFDRKSSVHHEADKYIPVISLALFSFSLGQSEAEELQKILHLYPNAVAEISLKKCSISDATWQHVFAGIGESAKSLQTLDLHLSAMPDNAVPRLSRSLRAMSSLRQLNVAGVTSSKDCLATVVSSLVNCHQLTNLDLSFCPVEDRGAHLLAELLERGGCPLVTLRLRSTQIRRDGARKLLTALKKHPRLTHFDIGGNRIGTGALGLLGEHLIYNRSMREITADDCDFSSEGCDALARALKSNSVLQHLDISRNRIGDSGSNLIADSLRYNTSLVSLGLNFCDVSNQGFSSLLDSLLSNVRLATLKLCYNQIGGRSYEGVVERSQSPCFSGDSDIDRESGLGRSTDESQFGEVDTTKIVSHDIQFNSTGVVGILDGCYVNSACMTTPKQSPLIGSSLRNVTTSNSSSNNGSYLNFDSDVNIYSKLTFVLQQNKTVKILLWGNNIESLDL